MDNSGRLTNEGKRRSSGRPRSKTRKSENSGRRRASIDAASKRTVYRRASEILNSADYDLRTIELAASIGRKRSRSLQNIQNVDNLYENMSDQENCLNIIKKHSNESALAFYLENNYSRRSYEELVHDTRSRGCPIYPSYQYVHNAMVECQPKGYISSEREVMVPLQEILNTTAERLCDSVAQSWKRSNLRNLEMLVTLGFDSSAGHTNPHQKCTDAENESGQPQQSLLVSSMAVLMIREVQSHECLWVNPTPQSVRFCRPLRIALEKEDSDTIMQEYSRLNDEINSLQSYSFKLSEKKTVFIKYHVSRSLFDGKCVNTITGNPASSRCPMCLHSVHDFSNLNNDFSVKESSLELGLGLLHAEIKCMEHLLHISYRIELKSWDIRKDYKAQVESRKLLIQKKIYDKIGVRVDQILQGHGTTNTGNTARTCFRNSVAFADALEIDSQIVCNLATILLAFKSKKFIQLDKLETFCWTTYCLYYKQFPWARMSPTVHKLLRHGCEIARKFPIPIAYYSEDANESWHKLYRSNMTSHARQNSRENRLLDVFNRAIHLSDPKISLILIERRLKYLKKIELPAEVKEFINESEIKKDGEDSDVSS